MLTWLQPWWLLGIIFSLALILLGRSAAVRRERSGPGLTLIHPSLLEALPQIAHTVPRSRRDWSIPFVLALFSTALAQPVWQGAWLKPPPLGRELVLLVDASKSMSIGDFSVGGQSIERLTVLKSLINRFVEARAGDKVGLVIFGDRASTLLPPTFDHELVQAMLARLPVGVAGENTALGEAVGLALKSIRGGAARRPALLLFTDGDSTAGVISPREATALAVQLKIPIYTVRVGTDLFGHAARTNGDFGLSEMAAASGGRAYTASSAQTLANVIRDIDALERSVTPPSTRRELQPLYLLPLLLAAIILLTARMRQVKSQLA